MDEAELDFRAALQEAVNECRRIGYRPTGFMGMITRSSAFDAVRNLLDKAEPSEGFTTLWEKGRLDLSVEAIVLKPEWRGYFTEAELGTARRRLAEVQYRAPWDGGEAVAVANTPQIESLLEELRASKGDRAEGKRIRAKLRALGHYGGLRQRENDIERGAARSNGTFANCAKTEPVVMPPVPDAESLIERIRSIASLPERNHEDVVKELLVRLGFNAGSIIFQQGYIDLCVLSRDGKTAAVFEVKRTIANESDRVGARRQGMDYAMKTGALIVVVTDGDRYEIYDRRKGHDYDAMLCGKFQLTAFRKTDSVTFDLLRPQHLNAVHA